MIWAADGINVHVSSSAPIEGCNELGRGDRCWVVAWASRRYVCSHNVDTRWWYSSTSSPPANRSMSGSENEHGKRDNQPWEDRSSRHRPLVQVQRNICSRLETLEDKNTLYGVTFHSTSMHTSIHEMTFSTSFAWSRNCSPSSLTRITCCLFR